MTNSDKPTYEELAQALMFRDAIWITALQTAVINLKNRIGVTDEKTWEYFLALATDEMALLPPYEIMPIAHDNIQAFMHYATSGEEVRPSIWERAMLDPDFGSGMEDDPHEF